MLKITAEFYKRLKVIFDYNKAVEEPGDVVNIPKKDMTIYSIKLHLLTRTGQCDDCKSCHAMQILNDNIEYIEKLIPVHECYKTSMPCSLLQQLTKNSTFGYTEPPNVYTSRVWWSKKRHKAMQYWFTEFWLWFEKNVEIKKELK